MDKEEPYIMIKELIHQEDISVITWREPKKGCWRKLPLFILEDLPGSGWLLLTSLYFLSDSRLG